MAKVIVVLCLLLASAYIVSAEFFTVDNVKYYISETKANWFEASRICKAEYGMVLVDIVTEQENDRILSLLKPFKGIAESRYWTSGTDLGSEDSFYWASSGHGILFNNFHPTQPDNRDDDENCVEITNNYDFKWNDEKCNTELFYICRNSVSYPLNNCICLNQ